MVRIIFFILSFSASILGIYSIGSNSFDARSSNFEDFYVKNPIAKSDAAFVFELNEYFIKNINHAFATYSLTDNYTLYLFSLISDNKHLGIVIPEDLMHKPHGICSQQSILFMYLAQMQGLKTRAVRLNGHFVSEVYFDNKWHLIDPDLNFRFSESEPSLSIAEIAESDETIQKNYLSKIKYRDKKLAQKFFEKIEYLGENEFPAKNLKLLHQITDFISKYLWILLWIIYFKFVKSKKYDIGVPKVSLTESSL